MKSSNASTHRPFMPSGEAGSFSIELAAIAPVLIVGLLLLIVYTGRINQVDTDLKAAAQAGARAASRQRDVGSAETAAVSIIRENLTLSELDCGDGAFDSLELDWSNAPLTELGLRVVTIRLSCNISLSNFLFLGVPGSRTFTASATEVLDRYRES